MYNKNPHKINKRVGKLSAIHRGFIYISMILNAVTGTLWLIQRELLATTTSHDRMVLIWHGISGFLVLISLGSVLPAHIRAAWRAHRNRVSGSSVLSLLSLTCVTALGLYYGEESSQYAFKWGHIILASMLMLLFPVHVIWGRRTKAK